MNFQLSKTGDSSLHASADIGKSLTIYFYKNLRPFIVYVILLKTYFFFIKLGNLNVAKVLVANGANVDLKNKIDRTPLRNAVDRGTCSECEYKKKHIELTIFSSILT